MQFWRKNAEMQVLKKKEKIRKKKAFCVPPLARGFSHFEGVQERGTPPLVGLCYIGSKTRNGVIPASFSPHGLING